MGASAINQVDLAEEALRVPTAEVEYARHHCDHAHQPRPEGRRGNLLGVVGRHCGVPAAALDRVAAKVEDVSPPSLQFDELVAVCRNNGRPR